MYNVNTHLLRGLVFVKRRGNKQLNWIELNVFIVIVQHSRC